MTSKNTRLADMKLDLHFVTQSRRLGLITLGELMDFKMETLCVKKDFTYTWYADVLALLKEKGLLEEFQKRQL